MIRSAPGCLFSPAAQVRRSEDVIKHHLFRESTPEKVKWTLLKLFERCQPCDGAGSAQSGAPRDETDARAPPEQLSQGAGWQNALAIPEAMYNSVPELLYLRLPASLEGRPDIRSNESRR